MSVVVMSESVAKVAPAVLKAQRAMGVAKKEANNPFFRSTYADLNAIREVAIPVLNAENVAVLQPTVSYDGKAFVRTLLLHESGEFVQSDTEILSADPGNPQAAGSGISYARRYGLQSLLNIGAVDDDAESAMGRKATKTEGKSTSSFRKSKKTTETPVTEMSTPTQTIDDQESGSNNGW